MSAVLTHPFQDRGLGLAPFRCIGVYEDRGPKIVSQAGGVTMMVGSPGQPMGTCAYCGTGIATCFQIRSADGREFIVGSDCVAKTGDAKLISLVKLQQREWDRARRAAKREAAYQAAVDRRQIEEQTERQRNGGKTDAEMAEERRLTKNAKKAESSRWLWETLEASDSRFGREVGGNLRLCIETLTGLSPRCLDICKDIYAKTAGHARSAAYRAKAEEFEAHLNGSKR